MGALWVLLCEGKCGAAAPCCFSCCQPVSTPLQKHQEKKIIVGQSRAIFFANDETSKWSCMFLFALAHRFIHFELF